MSFIVASIYIIISLIGLFCIFIGFPGNFIILFASVLIAWYYEFELIKLKIIIILFALAVLGEILEFIIGIVGSKKKKSSNKAIIGSMVFSVIGAIVFSPLLFGFGAIVGAFAGAFFGAFLIEYIKVKDASIAYQSGIGAFLGKLGGVLVKFVIGIIMITTTLYQIF